MLFCHSLGVRLSTVWNNTGKDIRDDELPNGMSSLVFTSTSDKKHLS
jgi:hypothetical protein